MRVGLTVITFACVLAAASTAHSAPAAPFARFGSPAAMGRVAMRAPALAPRAERMNAPGLAQARPALPPEFADSFATGEMFFVEALTPVVEATIQPRPGTYEADGLLQLRVVSAEPGWQLALHATALQSVTAGVTGAIESSEVHWRKSDSESAALNAIAVLAESGDPGETILEARLALATVSLHPLAVYEGSLEIHTRTPSGAEGPSLSALLRVRADRIEANHTIRGNKMFFHYGRTDKAQSAVISGHVVSDAPLTLSLAAAGRVDRLPMAKSNSPMVDPKGQAVPLRWRLNDGAGGRDPDFTASDGREIGWTLRGAPGETGYELECEALPEAFQSPGDYGQRIEVILRPIL